MRPFPYIIFGTISLLIFFWYFFFINLSIDTILLFLTSKLFMVAWISKGVFPLYNPYIFLGTPFAFDMGMGNLHPLNLLFILPYPFSYALWSSALSLLFLIGSYLFYFNITKKVYLSLLLTLMLFFSGSGFFIRMNNPTILSVIAHYGLFLYSLHFLMKKKENRYFVPLVCGFLITLAGHIQFVLYGYILGFIVAITVFKIDFKRIFIFYLFLFLITSWYYLLSLPLILSSTRMTEIYAKGNYIKPAQMLLFIFPTLFGHISNGSRWNAGPQPIMTVSLLSVLISSFLMIKRRISHLSLLIFIVLFMWAFGVVTIPFFREAEQVLVIFHVLFLTTIALQYRSIGYMEFVIFRYRKYIACLGSIFFIGGLLCYTKVFPRAFFLIKRPTNLFFDQLTVQSIGYLLGENLFLIFIFCIFLLLVSFFKKRWIAVMIVYVVLEGIYISAKHTSFIPSRIIVHKMKLPMEIDANNYRIQSAAGIVPFFGLQSYIDAVAFRPPFSKEPNIFDATEQKDFEYLQSLMNFIPPSWSMVTGIKSIQGYSTFVPRRLAEYFYHSSSDFKKEYDFIIRKNPLILDTPTSHINSLSTTKITLNDKRWEKLGVRYFITHSPLPSYTLLQKDERFFYENSRTLPIYRVIDQRGFFLKHSTKENPNEIVFTIHKAEKGKTLIVSINPDGFTATYNNKPIRIEKDTFSIKIKLKEEGIIKVYYSPILHLREVLKIEKFLL